MKKQIKWAIVCAIVIVVTITTVDSFASTPPLPGGGGSSDPPCWPPPCTVPIDGGISFLITAGIAYGGMILLNKRTFFN